MKQKEIDYYLQMILELRNEVDKLKIQNKKLRAEIKELASGGR